MGSASKEVSHETNANFHPILIVNFVAILIVNFVAILIANFVAILIANFVDRGPGRCAPRRGATVDLLLRLSFVRRLPATVEFVSLSIDTQRAPHGERAARQLVEALHDADDRIERHYLEVKSDVDLGTALGRAKVAKFILGAANRMPAMARRYFDGHAVMVLGVGGGEVSGIKPVEMLQLQQWLTPYLPSPAPGWDISRVPLSGGREVLLVIVDPPEQGQPMFVCCKDFQSDGSRKYSLRDGAVYVRGDGETREATSADLAALVQRASGPPRADLSLVSQGPALRYIADTSGLERWVTESRDGLLAALPSVAKPDEPSLRKLGAPPISGVGRRLGLADAFNQPENRTEDAYRAEVTAWEAACMEAMPTALDVIAASAWTPLTFRLESDIWLEDAEVHIHLDGDVEGVEIDPAARRRGLEDIFPAKPRKWGPRPSPVLYGPGIAIPAADLYTPRLSLPPRGSFQNGGSVTVTERVGDVRPEGSAVVGDDLDMVLLVKDPDLEQVTASWRLTARGQHVYKGPLTVPIETLQISDLFQALHPER